MKRLGLMMSCALAAALVLTIGVTPALHAAARSNPIGDLIRLAQISTADEADVLSEIAEVSTDPTASGTAASSEVANVQIAIPTDASDPVTIQSTLGDGAPELEVTMPVGVGHSQGMLDPSGAVVFRDDFSNATVALPTRDGSLQLVTVISSESAPTSYEYGIQSAGGGEIVLVGDGALFLDAAGSPVATVDAPWALDANGESVPTQFKVDGDSLIQVVDHVDSGAAYPIIADPKTRYYWWGQSQLFTKSETKKLAEADTATKFIAAFCSFIRVYPGGAVCAVAIIAFVSYWWGPIRDAARKGKCAALNQPYIGVVIGRILTWYTTVEKC